MECPPRAKFPLLPSLSNICINLPLIFSYEVAFVHPYKLKIQKKSSKRQKFGLQPSPPLPPKNVGRCRIGFEFRIPPMSPHAHVRF